MLKSFLNTSQFLKSVFLEEGRFSRTDWYFVQKYVVNDLNSSIRSILVSGDIEGMAASQLEKLVKGERNGSWSISFSDRIVKLLRYSSLNQPWILLQHGKRALAKYGVTNRDYWDTLSEMCRAASECGERHTAEKILFRIEQRFPNSLRCRVLKAEMLEAQGRRSEAMDLYIQVVATQPTSPIAYKRQIAVLKSELRWSEAVALTNHYLSIYAQDAEAWTELCAMSLRLGRLSHALFAASELIVNEPQNYANHLLLAEIYKTMAPTKHNLQMALVHYVTSANQRKTGNLRALYGIWLTSTLLINSCSVEDDSSLGRLFNIQSHAQAAVNAVYVSATCRQQSHDHVLELFRNPIHAD